MAQTDALGSTLGLFNTLSQMFLGSGKQKSTETSSISPGASAALSQIFANAFGNANDPSKTAGTIADLIHKSTVAFAPVLGAQNASGLYNSNTVGLLANEAQQNLGNASSKAVLDYQTAQDQIAARAAGDLASGSRTTTRTAATAPVINPAVTGVLAAGALGLKAYNNRAAISKFLGIDDGSSASDTVTSAATDAIGAGGPSYGDAINAFAGADLGGFGSPGGVVSDIAGGSGDGAGPLDIANFLGDNSFSFPDISSVGSDTASSLGLDSIGQGISTAANDVGDFFTGIFNSIF